jgi:hypothetical protein
MQATDVMSDQTIDTVLQVLSWLVIGFGSVWLVTGIIGYLHRRAYNLTSAESGSSKDIKPDFLKVDKKKRQAAIKQGAAFEKELEGRAVAVASPPADKLGAWSRTGATVSATFTLVAAVVSTLTRVDSLEAGVRQLSTWDKLSQTVQEHRIGAIVAFLVIGANVLVFVKATKKTPARG